MKIERIAAVLLITVVTLAVETIPSLAQNGGAKDQLAYTFTDLGSYEINGAFSGFNITNPDDDGVMRVVGTDLSVTWDVTKAGDLLSTNQLPWGVRAWAINDEGMIAFRVYENGWVTKFGIPGVGLVEPPLNGYLPSAVNNVGEVVGYSGWDGIRWTVDVDGTISARELPAFLPLAINDLGVMAGIDLIDSAAALAWIDEMGELQVEKLPGLLPGGFGVARGINNFGEVVGYSQPDSSDSPRWLPRPFLWSPREGLIDLGSLGGTEGAAMDINDRGQVVGWSRTSNYEKHAFLWQNEKMSDLNGLAKTGKWTLDSAQAINEAGAIVGGSHDQFYGDAGYFTFLLTPKP